MRTINSWNELRPFGIDALTGEACGLSYRLLCDVTQRGKRTIEKALGVKALDLPENWNRGGDEEPHVGSVMLAPELLAPLAIFALLEAGCVEVWRTSSGSLIGIEPTDAPERIEAWKQFHAQSDNFVRRYTYGGTAGDRNRHQMTGRVL
jgi:hypothetical protein